MRSGCSRRAACAARRRRKAPHRRHDGRDADQRRVGAADDDRRRQAAAGIGFRSGHAELQRSADRGRRGAGAVWHTESANTGFDKTLKSFNPRGSFTYRDERRRGGSRLGVQGLPRADVERVLPRLPRRQHADQPERRVAAGAAQRRRRGCSSAAACRPARLTGFWNILDDAITNITLSSTPALITKQRANADKVRAAGFEFEGDLRLLAR